MGGGKIMGGLVSKKEMLEQLSTLQNDHFFNVASIKNFIMAQPEVEKKGKWIKHEVILFDGCHTGRYFEECSECGKLTPEWRNVTEYHRWYFCPSCGACNARETTRNGNKEAQI